MREGSPRIVFATALMRAAFAGDLELVKLLLERGADPKIISRDSETMLSAAAGLAFIHGYHRGKSPEERLQVVKLFVELGNDVNWADDYGITPLMAAGNYGSVPIIQYLIDAGADLCAHDLGKKNDGQFGSSNEPLMPIDYAIGVGHVRAQQRRHHSPGRRRSDGEVHEGTRHRAHHVRVHAARLQLLAGQSRSEGRDPGGDRASAEFATGHQIEGLTGGLEAK